MSGNGNGGQMLTIQKLFEDPQRKAKLAEVMPKHLTPDRLIKVALNCISKVPKLQQCTASSLLQCLVTAAELGLEPGGALGHLYLVPFEDRKTGTTTCTAIVGYRGFIELARRSGQLAQIEAHVVHERDKFTLRYGLNPVLDHTPCLEGNPGKPVFVYMLARLRDGSVHCEAMTWTEVMRIKARSRSASFGPWVTDEEEMAKKTVIRRGAKYMPLSAELARALEADEEDFVEGEATQVQPPALAADNVLAQEIASPANEKAKAALRRKLEIKDVPPDGEPPADVVLPTGDNSASEDLPL